MRGDLSRLLCVDGDKFIDDYISTGVIFTRITQ